MQRLLKLTILLVALSVSAPLEAQLFDNGGPVGLQAYGLFAFDGVQDDFSAGRQFAPQQLHLLRRP